MTEERCNSIARIIFALIALAAIVVFIAHHPEMFNDWYTNYKNKWKAVAHKVPDSIGQYRLGDPAPRNAQFSKGKMHCTGEWNGEPAYFRFYTNDGMLSKIVAYVPMIGNYTVFRFRSHVLAPMQDAYGLPDKTYKKFPDVGAMASTMASGMEHYFRGCSCVNKWEIAWRNTNREAWIDFVERPSVPHELTYGVLYYRRGSPPYGHFAYSIRYQVFLKKYHQFESAR